MGETAHPPGAAGCVGSGSDFTQPHPLMNRPLLLTCALGLLGLLALPATAQVRSASQGFFLEGSLSGNSITAEIDDDESEASSGGGLGLRLGYGFNRMFAAYAALGAASIEADDDVLGEGTYGLGTLDLGVQVSFANAARPLVPFVNVGIGGVSLAAEVEADGDEFDIAISGGGLVLGAGARYHFSPALALTAGLEGFAGSLSTFEVDDEELDIDDGKYQGGRLRFGLTWFPGR